MHSNKNTLFNSQDEELIDYFIGNNQYTSLAIDQLKSKYANNAPQPLQRLLNNLEKFYYATTTEQPFKRSRDIESSNQTTIIEQCFARMRHALISFSEHIQSEAHNPATMTIMQNAEKYAMNAIIFRMKELEKITDSLFQSYQNNAGELKAYLDKSNEKKNKI